jgi:hypothetical protein
MFHMSKPRVAAILAAGAASLALAPSALAATDDGTASGNVGSELSVIAPDVHMDNMTHAGPNTKSGSVAVTSTGDWTLTAEDASGSATKGHLIKASELTDGPVNVGDALTDMVGFEFGGGAAASGTLNNQVSTSGSLSVDVPVTFTQTIPRFEGVRQGDEFGMTVNYTAVAFTPEP